MTTYDQRQVTKHQAQARLQQMPEAAALADLCALAKFWEKAVFSASYTACPTLLDHLVPTPLGAECISACVDATSLPNADVSLAMLGHFSWLDPLFDPIRSNVDELAALLTADLLNDRVRIPFQWSRELSDRIQDRPHLARHEGIAHRDAWQLIEGMPIGIFQHGAFITGPLGVIRSPERRWYPAASMVAFHYMLQGTRNRRWLRFYPASIGVVAAYEWINRFMHDRFGPPSEWDLALSVFSMDRDAYPQKSYLDAGLIVAECLSTSEKTAVLADALKSDLGSHLRSLLQNHPQLRTMKKLPPDELANKLPAEVAIQLMYSLTTPQIISVVEKCIANDLVTIPSMEVRKTKHSPPAPWPTVATEMGALGLRPGFPDPAARLLRVVTDAYSANDTLADLRWHLGAGEDEQIPTAMLHRLRTAGPADVVRTLVLTSPSIARHACGAVGLSLEDVQAKDTTAVERFLWKCGFELRSTASLGDTLREKAVSLEEMVDRIDFSGEKARMDIREKGNPLFVQVENFLDQLISLNVWCATQDHWCGSRFQFRLKRARRCVSEFLEPRYGKPPKAPPWDPERSSTLGTQLFYLDSLRRFVEGCRSADLAAVRRPNAVDYLDPADRPFPFLHLEFWADVDPKSLTIYSEVLGEFCTLLRQGDVAGVRNGLDHWREADEFPTREQIVTCCKKISMAVRLAEDRHLFPVLYWLDTKTQLVTRGFDEYDVRSSDRTRSVIRPSTLGGLPDVPWQAPLVFSPLQINDAADTAIFFKVVPASDYAEYWAGFPRYADRDPARNEQVNVEEQVTVTDASLDHNDRLSSDLT
jgi:hypothetical protein